MSKKLTLIFLAGLILGACSITAEKPKDTNLSLSETNNQTSAPTSTPTALPTPSADIDQLLKLKPGQMIYATIKTSKGSITVKLFPDKAPNTVANFVGLAEGTKTWTDPKTGQPVNGKSLYAGTIFHRVIKGFMIQGGDPLGNGMGNPGYKFADEPVTEPYSRGTIAMANSGPNTNGSQFFIMHADYQLPPNYTIFGRVDTSDSASLKVVDAIATQPTGANDRPVDPVTIESITIERK